MAEAERHEITETVHRLAKALKSDGDTEAEMAACFEILTIRVLCDINRIADAAERAVGYQTRT